MADTEKQAIAVDCLKNTIFNRKIESQIIPLLFEQTEAYDKMKARAKKEHLDLRTIQWVSQEDNNLADIVLALFEENHPASNLTENQTFKENWKDYFQTDHYYQDVVNGMLLSNDYILGKRYQFPGDCKTSPSPDDKAVQKARERYHFITEDLNQKKNYDQTVKRLADEVKDLADAL